MNDDNTTTQQQATDATPAGTGGKTFTQEQVNQIVSDRLAREREKQTGSEDYKAKYEAAQRELDSIKAGQTRAEKEAAVRAYFENKDRQGLRNCRAGRKGRNRRPCAGRGQDHRHRRA